MLRMSFLMRKCVWLLAVTAVLPAAAQTSITTQISSPDKKTVTTTNTEPAKIKITDLFQTAAVVAVVEILAGDTESYDGGVCKAKVLQAFKGASEGRTLYLEPCSRMELGGEYVVFLLDNGKVAKPQYPQSAPFGTIHYLEIFNQGYSAMLSSYDCKFSGRDIAHQCDYSVRVCTDYIILPKHFPTAPRQTIDTDFGCRLTRKTEFLDLLKSLASPPISIH
jgi:hypothetical protein